MTSGAGKSVKFLAVKKNYMITVVKVRVRRVNDNGLADIVYIAGQSGIRRVWSI
jgi:hypothetical protein